MGKVRIISFEGGEGSGKTTLIDRVGRYLEEHGYDYIVTREPGGVGISEDIRDIILDVNNTNMDKRTEALLYAAARRQHLMEKVIPAANEGKIVIFDRYVDSSLVYQGYVRGIGIEEVRQLNMFATEGFLPDVTFYVDVDPEIGLGRIKDGNREQNRLDLEHMDFHHKVREGYEILCDMYPERVMKINGNASADEVYEETMAKITSLLEEK